MPKQSNCRYCDIEFTVHHNSKGIYCSNKCQQDFRVMESMNSDAPTLTNGTTYMKRFVSRVCSCGIGEIWNDKPLRLQIDHIDGDRTNNKKENLQWLCPNCHTQTDTWGVKNVSKSGKERMTAGAIKGNKKQNGLLV